MTQQFLFHILYDTLPCSILTVLILKLVDDLTSKGD